MQAEIVDMMIGTCIDGVFMDMQATCIAKDNAKDVEEGRKCWQQKWNEWMPLLTLRH